MKKRGFIRRNFLRKENRAGFTLIETLVYIGLFSMIIGGAIISAYNIFESTNRNQTKAMVAEEGIYLIGKINWALTGATSVNVPFSNQLSVTKFGIPSTDNPLVFDDSLGEMRLKRGANAPQVLNNANVMVNNLIFVHTVSSGDGITLESISASFTIDAKTPEGLQFSEDFHTVKYIRK